jgi:predicted metal-dependent phosphoesterase TrpH
LDFALDMLYNSISSAYLIKEWFFHDKPICRARRRPMMYLYETHMHTSPSSACANCTPAEQVRAYKRRGYAGIIVTDHFINGNSGCPSYLSWEKKIEFFASGYKKAKKAGVSCGLDVFLGWEFNCNGKEFLTYGLTLEFLLANPDIDRLTAEQYSVLARSSGGFLAQAHPYRDGWWIADPNPARPDMMDAVEVYNASMPDDVNAKAREFARLHGLPMQAGSDSHFSGHSFASGIALTKKAKSILDIIEAIKTNQAELILPY